MELEFKDKSRLAHLGAANPVEKYFFTPVNSYLLPITSYLWRPPT